MKISNKKAGIAIIGMSCRFPGANNPQEFWDVISNGQSKFSSIPLDRLQKFDFRPIETLRGSFLENPFDFGNTYFKISEVEAIAMDPQQRIMLELALEAIESGLSKDFEDRNIGVFIGANQRSYLDGIISMSYREQFIDKIKELDTFRKIAPDLKEELLTEFSTLTKDDFYNSTTLTGNISNLISGRISHEFNLTGPSLTIDTACSSSLVAIHNACESLYNDECNLALAGGINLNLNPTLFSLMEKSGAISPTGNCIPFSEKSDGILLGEGGGLVLLKKYENAIEDGDKIIAVIKGSGVNNDGRSLGILAPSWKGQLSLLESVYSKSNFDRNNIGLIEAHGTSTRIGDSVEMTVMERFFDKRETPLSIGSVKSNIGHTMGASGIAGLIKVVMALQAKKLPPSLYGEKINPKWKLKDKGFSIQEKLEDWQSKTKLAAGISSFGFGGTNAHIIVEEPDSGLIKDRVPFGYTKLERKKFEYNLFPRKEIDRESLFSITWEANDFEEIETSYCPDVWLLFCDENQLNLRHQILKTNIDCITIHPGDIFTRLDENTFTIDFGNENHIRWLIEGFDNKKTLGIIYSPLLNGEENVDKTIKELVFVKNIFVVGNEVENQCRTWCICQNSHKVNDQESLSPHEHSIAALFSSALNENVKMQGGVINVKSDIEEDISLIPKLISHIQSGPLVIRNNKFYTPVLCSEKTDAIANEASKFHNKGVYLIIGGSSGIGEEIGKYIKDQFNANIIISGTRKQKDLSEQLNSYTGANFRYFQGSVKDKNELKTIIDHIFKTYGKLNGIIFSAGAFNMGALKTISNSEFHRVIDTKLIGLRNLYELINEHQVDFVYLLSSASSLSPSWSYGIAAYGASNAYLNAFCEKISSDKTTWLSRSWSIWENIGMSKNFDTSTFKSMEPFNISEALELFKFSMLLDHPHLAVLHKQDAEKFSLNWSTQKAKTRTPTAMPIEKMATSNKSSIDFKLYLKQLVAEAAELDLSEIDEEESFTNIGLDSISALDVVSKLEKKYAISLNPTLLFEYDSIERLTQYFDELNVIQTGAFSVSPTQIKLSTSGKSSIDFKLYLKQLVAGAAELDLSEIDEEESFTNIGLDSISALDVVSKLEKKYAISLNPTLLFEYDSIERLTQYFDELNVSKTDLFPLLSTQKSFYSNQIFYPDLPCNCMVKMSFENQFDINILCKAWDAIIDQHQSMNLVFEMTENGPIQRIADFPVNTIEIFNIEKKEDSNDFIKNLENTIVNKVYEFNNSPLYDLCYVEIEKSTSVLLFNAHHIIIDAWSMNLLLSGLLKIYNEWNSDNLKFTPSSIPSFFSYVNYIKNKKQDDNEELSSKYWEMELKAFKPFNLPNKKVLDCLNGNESYSFNEVLDAETLLKVENTAKAQSITIFQMLLSCYFKTIQDFSGHDDLVIRLATDNRDRSFNDNQLIIGCIADSIPLRIRITKNDDIVSICNKVKSKLIEVGNYDTLSSIDYANMHNSRSERGPVGITPFGMSYLNIDYFNKINDIKLPFIEARNALPFTDLSLICFKQNNSLYIGWNYSSASFSKTSIEEISKTYLNVLLNAGTPKQLINSEKEITPLVMPTKTLFLDKPLLHNKVFAACDIFKTTIAINDNGKRIDYSTLKTKSIQLANTLISSKNNKGETIGILEYPGTNAVIGILGILASDCAYIPLDPDWPTKRIEGIISHSHIDVLVTSTAHFNAIAENKLLLKQLKTIVLLDEEDINISDYKNITFLFYSQESGVKLFPSLKIISPQSLAYIMYTSGTTGVPKGVMVNHSTVEIFLSWISEEFEISKKDKFIATSSLGFGGSIRQIFSTLLAGGEICPIDRFDFKDPKSLLHFLEENSITILNTVPSVLQNICDFMDLNDFSEATYQLPSLRLILVGGEILQGQTIAQWKNIFGPTQSIFNLYGSTETIVNATFHEVGNEVNIPIGKTRKGSHILLINEKGSLCNLDEKGELYVGGPSLSSGYYKDDLITKKKFVNIKIRGAKGIYYRTGDLAKIDTNSNYYYLGRNDNQIQLFGNRIEPAEIEGVLVANKSIKNAAVLGFKTESEHFLVAFIESTLNADNYSEIEIRNIVAEKLPPYMIPQKVEFLDKLPFNHAGKIDRGKLRGLFNNKESQNHNAATTHTQSIIKNIWEKTLKIKGIDPNHDFFRIGGDSILALKVLHHLRKEFLIAPKPVELFRKRTINQLSACIDELNEESYHKVDQENSIINGQVGVNDQLQFPLSYSQKGFLFFNKLNPNSSPNLVTLVPVLGELDTEVFQNTFNYLISRHPILRTRFLTEGIQSFQKIMPIKNISIDITDISEKPINEQNEIVKRFFETYKKLKFNLSNPPLFRIEILKHSKFSYTLILCMHHIIGDAWSLKILTDELLKVYDEMLKGNSGALPELQTSFFDFVMLESKMNITSPERMKTLEGFWRGTFKGLYEKEMNDKDFSSEKDENPIALKFTTVQKENLKLQCLKNGISLFQLIFASYARALQEILNTDSILINSATSGREMEFNGIDQIIGCFTRNIPVKISLADVNLLNNVRVVEKAFLSSLDHQDIPPNNQIKILLENGTGKIDALYKFIISFMDFTSLSDYSSSKIELDWNKANFFFNAGSVESYLMLGIRVSDEILISFNGCAKSSFKNEVKKMMENELVGFMELSSQKAEIQLPKSDNTIDSALIAYLPAIESLSELLPFANKSKVLAREFINKLLPNGEPKLLEIEETIYGRAGVIFLPLPSDELILLKQEKLLELILKAIKVAELHGASHISLAGNLSSKTNYCYSVIKKMDSEEFQNLNMVVTTGHSCTVVAVIKTIEKALTELELNIEDLIVGVAGFGSIGQASLSLLLVKIGHPAKIIISDLASQIPSLKRNIKDLQNGYQNSIEIIAVEGIMPKEFYSANLIIGASSQGQILDVDQILPGTILADDSFPHIIDTQKAIKRMKTEKDVLIIGAGKINLGEKCRKLIDWPISEDKVKQVLQKVGDEGLPGCLVESIMMCYNKTLPATIGLVTASNAIQYWNQLTDLKISAVKFHLQGFEIDNNLLKNIKYIQN